MRNYLSFETLVISESKIFIKNVFIALGTEDQISLWKSSFKEGISQFVGILVTVPSTCATVVRQMTLFSLGAIAQVRLLRFSIFEYCYFCSRSHSLFRHSILLAIAICKVSKRLLFCFSFICTPLCIDILIFACTIYVHT